MAVLPPRRLAAAGLVAFVCFLILWVKDRNEKDKLFHSSTTSIRTEKQRSTGNRTTPANYQPDRDDLLPPPLQIFTEYTKQHSNDVLWDEYNVKVGSASIDDRKFVIAYYWCPHRAGNILHNFFNSFAWALIHNRTVLWKFLPLLKTASGEDVCQAILKRAIWLPSYDEWSDRLHLPPPVPVSLLAGKWEDEDQHKLVLYPQYPDVIEVIDKEFSSHTVSRHRWSDHPRKRKDSMEYLQSLPHDMQVRTDQLYMQTQGFLYGMLFSNLFTIQFLPSENVITEAGSSYNLEMVSNDDNSYSVALHSRHLVAADDGSYVPFEVKCLNKTLSSLVKRHGSTAACKVYLMSDRENTIQSVTAYLLHLHDLTEGPNCTVITANHNEGRGPVGEHGPWAGAGFFQDLDVVGNARDAIVADLHRSSSTLLYEVMEYRRRMHYWDKIVSGGESVEWKNSKIGDLNHCKLPNHGLDGYDYGPGTPTFMHHSHLQSLPPVGMLDGYVKSIALLTGREDRKQFVVVSVDYEEPTPEEVYRALNALIFSLLFNRTFVVVSGQQDYDSTIFEPKEWVHQLQNMPFGTMDEIVVDSTAVDVMFQLTPYNESALTTTAFPSVPYGKDSWNASLQEAGITSTNSTAFQSLELLYGNGPDFLYGMLFHRTFSISDTFPSPWEDSHQFAQSSLVVEMHIDDISRHPERLAQCLVQLIPQANGDLLEEACHIFFLLKSKHGGNSTGSSLDQLQTRCSSTVLVDSAMNSTMLNGDWWRLLHLISRARAGWITAMRPKDDSALSASSSISSTMILQWIEYHRYLETWKLGRQPFVIQELPHCFYDTLD